MEKNFQCDNCHKQYKSIQQCNNHKQYCKMEQVTCKICNKTIKKCFLKQHHERKHMGKSTQMTKEVHNTDTTAKVGTLNEIKKETDDINYEKDSLEIGEGNEIGIQNQPSESEIQGNLLRGIDKKH